MDSAPIRDEIARRQKVHEFLERLRPSVVANLTKVVQDEAAHKLLDSRFSKLPANVILTPTSLHIDFSDTKDFLSAFGAVVFALNNDYEAISSFIEGALPPGKVTVEL